MADLPNELLAKRANETMSISTDDGTPTEALADRTPSETFERLRVAAASRASLLRAAHLRLEDDLRDLREKACTGR